MSTAIYVLSSPEKSKKDEYKFGIHTGSEKKLRSRYRTYFMNVKIYYFNYVSNAKVCEDILKKRIEKYRLFNDSDKLSEWTKIDIDKLLRIIKEIVSITKIINDNKIKMIDNKIINKKNEVKELIDFGKEDISKFTEKELKLMLYADNNSISMEKYILFVHYNKKYPEYHNCYYPNNKKECVYIIENGAWTESGIFTIYEKLKKKSDDFYKKMMEDNKKFKKYDEHIKKYERCYEGYDKIAQLNYLKNILYDNRNRIKNTYQMTKHYTPKHDYLDGSEEE